MRHSYRIRTFALGSIVLAASACVDRSVAEYTVRSEALRPGWIDMPQPLLGRFASEGEATRCLTGATTLPVGVGPSVLVTESRANTIEISCGSARGRWEIDTQFIDEVLVQVSKAGPLPIELRKGDFVRMEATPMQGGASPGVRCDWSSTDHVVLVVLGDGRAGFARGMATGLAQAVVVCEGLAGIVPFQVLE